jgi:hypothetical protein
MKKFMITAILMIATSGLLSAQNANTGNGNPGTNKKATGYVDVNKNGVCDTYENGNRQAVKGSGQAAGYGKGNGQCRSAANQGRRTGNRGCRRPA